MGRDVVSTGGKAHPPPLHTHLALASFSSGVTSFFSSEEPRHDCLGRASISLLSLYFGGTLA